MANPTGKGGFTPGHKRYATKGRPRSAASLIKSANLELALQKGQKALPEILDKLFEGAKKGDKKLIEIALDLLIPKQKPDIIELSVDAEVDLSVEGLKRMTTDELCELMAKYIKNKDLLKKCQPQKSS